MFRMVLWNIDKPDTMERQSAIAAAVRAMRSELQIDMIALVEPPRVGSHLYGELLTGGFHYWGATESRFAVFSTFSAVLAKAFELPSNPGRYECWLLTLPGLSDLNLFLVHGRDRRNNNSAAREADMRQLAEDVQLVERKAGHQQSIVFGDFNDQPFNNSLLRFDFLHATNSQHIVNRGVRQLHKRMSTPFYNPSWSLMNDVHNKIPGTYFLESPEEDEMHWNTLDQFLLRESLVPAFRAGGIRVITELNDHTFLDAANRPANHLSDHLPVLLELELERQLK